MAIEAEISFKLQMSFNWWQYYYNKAQTKQKQISLQSYINSKGHVTGNEYSVEREKK
jgi:hypothetical protein